MMGTLAVKGLSQIFIFTLPCDSSEDFMKKGLHKTFWGTKKKYENKNLS